MTHAFRRLDSSIMTAPFDGLVMSVHTDLRLGAWVDSLAPLVVIARSTSVEIRSDMTEAETAKLAIGQSAMVEFSPQTRTVGQILEIGEPNNGMRPVRIGVSGDIPPARLGSQVKVTITLQQDDNALILPNSAVRTFEGKYFIHVLEEGRKKQVDVEIGIQTATETQIVAGVEEGQEVLGR